MLMNNKAIKKIIKKGNNEKNETIVNTVKIKMKK